MQKPSFNFVEEKQNAGEVEGPKGRHLECNVSYDAGCCSLFLHGQDSTEMVISPISSHLKSKEKNVDVYVHSLFPISNCSC